MKNCIRIIFVCLLLVCMTSTGFAFETTNTKPEDHKALASMGSGFKPIADKFGCPEFAWANIIEGGKMAALEYVPAGVKVSEWKRMVSVTVYALSGDKKIDGELLKKLQDGVLAAYKAKAKVNKSETFFNQANEPAMYIDYQIGEGAMLENNAGVFMRTGSKFAAFIQIQSRGKPLDKADLDRIRQMLTNPTAAKK